MESANTKDDVRTADHLVRAAVDFLSALFPVANMHVTYEETEAVKQWSSYREVLETGAESPLIHRDKREVPNRPDYCRVVGINLDEKVSRFFGEASRHKLHYAYTRLFIPVEVAHTWTEQLSADVRPDVRAALESKLPTHIIARIVADRYARLTEDKRFSFLHYGQGTQHDQLAETIVDCIEYMDELAAAHVEHKEISHAVLIAPGDSEEDGAAAAGSYPGRIGELQCTPLLSDGFRSLLWISPEGELRRLIPSSEFEREIDLSEMDFGALTFVAAASKAHSGITLMLRPGGSIVTFADGRPLFIRRHGAWRGMLWDSIRDVLSERYGVVGATVFDVALLQTTSGQGSLIGIANEVPDGISRKDRVDLARASDMEADDVPKEWIMHRLLPGGRIGETDAATLSMLAGIDGAVVVDEEGRLITYGAVLPSQQGQTEGARAAAARYLSRHGCAVKVSEDGPIQLFEDGECLLEV